MKTVDFYNRIIIYYIVNHFAPDYNRIAKFSFQEVYALLSYRIKLGIVPVRRDVTPRPGIFNWEVAERRGRELTETVIARYGDEQTEFVDIKGINPVDVMINEDDAQKIIERFTAEKVDGVFFINANFGNEEAIGVVAAALKVPVCIWAPLDDRFDADGMRYTDSQCGIFGVSRMLQRRNVPFSHIETCRVDSPAFARDLTRFENVVCMVRNFRTLKVAQVGMRPRPFCSVIFNEGELMRKFDIRTIPINLAVIIDKYNRILETRKEELEKGKELLLSRYEMDDLTPPLLEKVYAFVLLYEEIFEEYGVGAISAECWTAMQLAVGAMPCTAYSVLADKGYLISCESDMHAVITMVLLASATRGRKIPFLGEFTVRHPENENAELLWHCGPFAYSLKAPDSKAKNVNMRQWFRVNDGSYTVARFEEDNGVYRILNGTAKATTGPYTFGTYLWAEFDGLKRWEDKLIDGPYIHHCVEVEGDVTAEIAEFCRYIPMLENDPMDR